ncbi:helix-turn-helix domain-containing protein [Herbiconiux ginsengi]|uniref:Transcriptional regulator, XRE family with cupin sensor n=1 Tax=Herbiconiux ginsengi TaxID=381665 RepID=A0A1H3TW37_9MICO|nr:XRE family transcriptional regulator [Herbiconiux ginsengi]SDZ53981.1 transcriptional regulator, XRE family with cupin sensor [Herbiconiux ginsengi]
MSKPIDHIDTEAVKLLLGQRLRDLRGSQRVSLRQLAAIVGCSASALSQIENGLVWPSVDLLMRVAHELGASFDELLGQREGPASPTRTDSPVASIDSIELTSSVLEPGRAAEAEPLGADGVGFVYVAEGELTLDLDSVCFVLSEGSTMRFNPARRTRYSNRGSHPVRALWGHVHTPVPPRSADTSSNAPTGATRKEHR